MTSSLPEREKPRPSTPSWRSRLRRNWRTLAIVGVSIFLIADIILVVVALGVNDSDDTAPSSAPTYVIDAPASPAATPTSTPTATTPAIAAAPRVFAAANGTSAWRANAAVCSDAPAVFERSDDGGETFSSVDLEAFDIRQVLAIRADSESVVTIVAAVGDGCEVSEFRSFTAGAFWADYEAGDGAAAFIDSAEPATVQFPDRDVAAPCAPLQLAEGDSVAVLCTNQVHVLDADDGWREVSIPGALAIAANDSGFVIAAAGGEDCAGISILSLEASSAEAQKVGCFTAESAPQAVSIAQAGDAVWLWSGSSVSVSTDAGATW
ncbi:hypothetical protein ESZ53_08380 [Salinibacterium sp. UTAS2018]|uniref:hypothetical protein n=1 Tax=Salinibacterium sp. UTAS2018 TaxID=2508880 RepID=UPI0010097B3C|nr:hypothetical protein [Salinibacterium sp. UTAS2018]QAV70455.1 hypothetical protein ESZ53_08380 [Salinibacterium sp. UTAS2018]